MADTKIVGGSVVVCDPKHGRHRDDCDCHVDGRTIVGDGSKKYPFKTISLFPQKFASPSKKVTIFVRADGSDKKGDGLTDKTAYRTIQRAVLDVPLDIPGGYYYYVDCTNLLDGGPEILPPDYALPAWKAPRAFDTDLSDPVFLVQCAVNIRAELRDAQTLGSEAIVNAEDLLPTVIGSIANITIGGGGEVEVTMSTDHGLWAAPFPIQIVTITDVTGSVGDVANGDHFVFVTGPTTFILDGVDGTGLVYGGGGSVSVLYVQDQISGQVQVKVSAPRDNWAAGSLKGKIFVDPAGVFTNGVIYDNTEDTLYLTTIYAPTITPGSPGRITEQSCALVCSSPTIFGFVGGFNVHNQDSLSMMGISVRPSDPDGPGLHQFGGNVWLQGCLLERPSFVNALRQANSNFTYMINSDFSGAIYQNRGLFESCEANNIDWWFAFDGTVFLNQSEDNSPLGISNDGGDRSWLGVKIKDSASDPIFFSNGGNVLLEQVSIDGGVGDAVVVAGQGRAILHGVAGSGWPGVALTVNHGAQVEVDSLTFTNDGVDVMQVGGLDPRTFENFRSGLDTGEVNQQLDITGFNADPMKFGATGTCSRVFQP